MFVQRLTLQFMEPLRALSSDVLQQYDRIFLDRIEKEFATANSQAPITAAQLQWLVKLFSERWAIIADAENDYTIRSDGANEFWIALALDLAKKTKKHQLQILMPTITNTYDPINLNKYPEGTLPVEYYRGDDVSILYSIQGLLETYQKTRVFSIYNDVVKYYLLGLTLPELARIRDKVSGRDFVISGKVYHRFWDYLTLVIAPEWATQGELPQYLLRPLLQLVELYFDEKQLPVAKRTFVEKLRLWSDCLKESKVRDVNCLYGQLIVTPIGQTYLLDALVDIYQNVDDDLDNTMISIARWLARYDESLISETHELVETYTDLGLGRAFDVLKLKRYLQEDLLSTCGGDGCTVRGGILILLTRLQTKTVIDRKTMVDLGAVYRRRWLQIQGGPLDYSKLQSGVNLPWIHLARILCGAGLIRTNYYQFMMPTITQQDIDPITRDLYTAYPLSHYILSEDATSLILLDHSLSRLKDTKFFCNCSCAQPRPFTPVEVDRIQHASVMFHQYISLAVSKGLDDPPISRNTVMALKNLVDGSLYSEGLLFLHNYDETQEQASQRAYHLFYNFLKQMDPLERNRLDYQTILFHGKSLTFAEVMSDIEHGGSDGEGGCIAVNGQFIAQLVMDYAPYLRFNDRLEQRVDIDSMRSVSRRKVFKEYEDLTEIDAKRRIQILAVSLMTHTFQFPGIGQSETIWDSSNSMVQKSHAIAQLIIPMLKSGSYQGARSIFVTILESIVKPALEERDQSWFVWMTRYADTNQWLNSIANGSMFTSKQAWFDPHVLMECLFVMANHNLDLRPHLEPFLDELIHTYAQHERDYLKEIRVNIQFIALLQKLSSKDSKRVMDVVAAGIEKVRKPQFNRLCAEFLTHRLVDICVSTSKATTSAFFSAGSTCDSKKIHDIVSGYIGTGLHTPVHQLALKLKDCVHATEASVCNEKSKLAMKNYLERIILLIPTFGERSKVSASVNETPSEEPMAFRSRVV